jgi:DNA polymerase-3 subunit alpha
MGAIKESVSAATIVENRKDAKYKSRLSQAHRSKSANKKAIENLALAGGFDSFRDHKSAVFS